MKSVNCDNQILPCSLTRVIVHIECSLNIVQGNQTVIPYVTSIINEPTRQMFPLELAVRLTPRMATTSIRRLTSQASSSGVVINVNYKAAIAERSFHSSPIRSGPKKSKLNM